ncbi:MAG TPA: response regulator transcription factor [Cellvibrionaceae bacterium]
MTTILIIDDDQTLCELLAEYLQSHHMQVDICHDGAAGLEKATNSNPDLILLDVMLPSMNGFEVLRELRKTSRVPVLMLTARGDEIDRVLGLEMGADDYVAKPFSHRELVARIQAILRRLSPDNHSVGELELKPESLEANYHGQPLTLTAAEFRVLNILFEHPGEIVTKEAICQQAFGRHLQPYDRHIDIHISHIRKKMSAINDDILAIRTLRGAGYQLIAEPR